jgi:hypothetical protein
MKDVIAAALALRDAADRLAAALHKVASRGTLPSTRDVTPADAAALALVETAWLAAFGPAPVRTPVLLAFAPEHPLGAALAHAGARPLRLHSPVSLGGLLGRLARLPGSRLRPQHTAAGSCWRLAPRP